MGEETYAFKGLPQETRSSLREIDSLGEALDRLGTKRAMLICGNNVLTKSDVVTRVRDAIGSKFVGQFEGVEVHAPVETVEAAADMARSLQPDTLISVGGGSAVITAKATALLFSTDKTLADYRIRIEPPDRIVLSELPLPEVNLRTVSVATTMGNAETNFAVGAFALPADSGKLIIYADARIAPKLIIIDGDALATTPTSIQTGTAIGQLRIAIEAVSAVGRNFMSDALGLYAIKLIFRELQDGWKSDPASLLRTKAACNLAAHAQLAIGLLGIGSAIVNQMGAICDIDHGDAHAVLLPHTIRFNAIEAESQYRLIARALDIQDEGLTATGVAEAVATRVEGLCETLGVPRRLRDIGVSADCFDNVAVLVAGGGAFRNNARPVRNKDEIVGILERAW